MWSSMRDDSLPSYLVYENDQASRCIYPNMVMQPYTIVC